MERTSITWLSGTIIAFITHVCLPFLLGDGLAGPIVTCSAVDRQYAHLNTGRLAPPFNYSDITIFLLQSNPSRGRRNENFFCLFFISSKYFFSAQDFCLFS
jgi:hypothetical protein